MSPSVRGLTGDVVRRYCATLLVVAMLATGVVLNVGPSQATVIATDRIALGTSHTCVINNDNTVWCWGSNAMGQLGVSSSVVPSRSTVPVRADGLPGGRVAVKIAAGASHTCVVANDGTVWCWGANPSGQVTNSIDALIRVPANNALPSSAISIFAGGENSCALLVDKQLFCWGLNSSGQLGIGSSDNNVNGTPRVVGNIPQSFEVADLSIGRAHMCAVSTQNQVWCWGDTAHGKLAVAPGANVTYVQRLNNVSAGATRVGAGAEHTCVALATSVSCFGDNSLGQLGYMPFNMSNPTPIATGMGATVNDVVAGEEFTCARLQGVAPSCWGANASLQLGTGSTSTLERETPAAVTGLDGTVVDLALGASHGCALMASGQLRCWGSNSQGQLGVGDRTNRHTATAVSTLNVVPTTTTTTTITTPPTAPPTTPTTLPVTPTPTTSPSTDTATAPPIVSEATTTTQFVVAHDTKLANTQPVITPLRLRRGRSVSASKIAVAVSMTIPKTSQGKLRISIVAGTRFCTFNGNSIRAVQKGRCTIAVTMVPKRGRTFTRQTTITVR